MAARLLCGLGPMLFALLAAGCNEGPLLAPDGSRIDLTIAPTVVAADGDTARVSALVTEADGVTVEDGTRVTYVASGGMLCQQSTVAGQPCEWVPVATTETRGGVGSLALLSGKGPTITITARSGSVSATKDLTVSSLVAPTGTKVLVDSDSATLAVGGRTAVMAYFTTADGSPVPDQTRVVFTAKSGSLGRTIALTQAGFVRTTLTARAAGEDTVSAVSGAVHGSHTLVVH